MIVFGESLAINTKKYRKKKRTQTLVPSLLEIQNIAHEEKDIVFLSHIKTLRNIATVCGKVKLSFHDPVNS